MPDDQEVLDDDEQSQDSPVIRDLREKAKEADTAKAEAAAARRELTLHKAGLGNLTEKQMKALNAAHEGDWEPESIKATAAELGFLHTDDEQKPDGPQIPATELASMQRVQSTSGAQAPPPVPSTDAERAAAYAAAETPEQLTAMLREAGQLAE